MFGFGIQMINLLIKSFILLDIALISVKIVKRVFITGTDYSKELLANTMKHNLKQPVERCNKIELDSYKTIREFILHNPDEFVHFDD